MPALLTPHLPLAGLGAALCLALPAAGFAADTGSGKAWSSCQPLGVVERRVVAKAEVGVEALRDYVYITRGIHRLSMIDVTKHLDDWLAAAHCAGMAVDETAVRRNVALAARMPRI